MQQSHHARMMLASDCVHASALSLAVKAELPDQRWIFFQGRWSARRCPLTCSRPPCPLRLAALVSPSRTPLSTQRRYHWRLPVTGKNVPARLLQRCAAQRPAVAASETKLGHSTSSHLSAGLLHQVVVKPVPKQERKRPYQLRTIRPQHTPSVMTWPRSRLMLTLLSRHHNGALCVPQSFWN